MTNPYFQFKQFIIHQDKSAMKVTTDGCLFGAWIAGRIKIEKKIINHCLDIGTGTGLLAIMLAEQNETFIDAIEIDKDAFEQATENAAASPWTERIKIIHADVRKFKFQNQYDVIISNPPFYEKELKGDNAKKNLAHHNDGLLLAKLFSLIKKNLKPGGTFFLLLPYKRNEEIKNMFTENDLVIQQLTYVRQSIDHDFFRIMIAGKLKTDELTEPIIDEMSIKEDNDQYTQVFKDLLKDYYLHL